MTIEQAENAALFIKDLFHVTATIFCRSDGQCGFVTHSKNLRKCTTLITHEDVVRFIKETAL